METSPIFSPEKKIVAAKDQISCDLAEESVILNFPDGMYYGLNAVGSRIWSLIQNPCSIEEILTTLIDEFDVERSRCESDVFSFLQELLSRNMIIVQDETNS